MPRKPAKHPVKPKRGKKLETEEPGVLYGRYSSHNQKDISVEQQFEKGYELAAEYGIKIIDTYADRAVSGRTDKRKDFQRMMSDAAKGKFRYVIAWKSNRMGRNMLEALEDMMDSITPLTAWAIVAAPGNWRMEEGGNECEA